MLKQKMPIKYFMVAYVGTILVVSSFALHAPERFLKGILIIILYAGFDLLWTYAREKIWYLPVSSWISGLILSVVALPDPSITFLIALPLLAVFSKQVMHFGKMRHIFNPAAFAMAVTALVAPAISWWGVAWSTAERGTFPVIAVLTLVGVFILWRQNRWHITISFLISYAVFIAINLFLAGIPAAQIPQFLKTQLIDGTTIFFATVMLIEPLTSTFPQKQDRVIYGILVGFFAVLAAYAVSIPQISRLPFAGNIDPLIFGLLMGNVSAALLFLPSRPKPVPTSTPASSSISAA